MRAFDPSPVSIPSSGTSSRAFPEGFVWGAATAAHQVEGNNVNSNWWVHENEPGTTIVEPSGDAADSFHRFRDDIRLLAGSGLNSYRFSLEWARIEPERGMVSRASVDHYRRMVDTCLEFGVEPIVTLMHFTVPRWFERDGFWRAPDATELFARYVQHALPIVSSGVRYVCTINEPNIAAMLAGGEDASNLVAYGLPKPDLAVADTLLASHWMARGVLSQVSGIQSGWTVATQAFEAADEEGAAEKLREIAYPAEDWYLENVAGNDFIGVQAYTRNIVGPEGVRPPAADVEKTLTGWEFWPDAAATGVRNAWNLGDGTPLLVTENGIATSDDSRRIAYTSAALAALADCIDDGIDLRGYLHWSLLDNYEWASGFAPTFGLIAWDRETFERHPKPSLEWLGGVARANAVDAPDRAVTAAPATPAASAAPAAPATSPASAPPGVPLAVPVVPVGSAVAPGVPDLSSEPDPDMSAQSDLPDSQRQDWSPFSDWAAASDWTAEQDAPGSADPDWSPAVEKDDAR